MTWYPSSSSSRCWLIILFLALQQYSSITSESKICIFSYLILPNTRTLIILLCFIYTHYTILYSSFCINLFNLLFTGTLHFYTKLFELNIHQVVPSALVIWHVLRHILYSYIVIFYTPI